MNEIEFAICVNCGANERSKNMLVNGDMKSNSDTNYKFCGYCGSENLKFYRQSDTLSEKEARMHVGHLLVGIITDLYRDKPDVALGKLQDSISIVQQLCKSKMVKYLKGEK